MGTPTTFRGITSISGVTHSDQLQANLLSFFDWGMLNIGGFTSISRSENSFYGDISQLRPVQDAQYADGRVWEGYRSNWVWESGLETGLTPNKVSGIWVNGIYQSSGFSVDYPKGRVILTNKVATSSVVQTNFSTKWVLWDIAESNYFRQAIHDAYNVNDATYLQFGSGNWQQNPPARVQYPFVAIEIVDASIPRGYQLGGGSEVNQDVLFHVFTESRSDRNKICDIIFYQNLHNIFMYDLAVVSAQQLFPLTAGGDIGPRARNYPQLVNDPALRYTKVWFSDTKKTIMDQLTPKVFHGVVRTTVVRYAPEL